MTLRGLAALGVLAIAGCKQPIINVYPAACATPDSGVSQTYIWPNAPGAKWDIVPALTPTPVATPTPEDVAGCPSTVLVLTYETQQTIKLPFDYAMTEADGESNCWYWLNGDQANGMHGQGVSILRGKQ